MSSGAWTNKAVVDSDGQDLGKECHAMNFAAISITLEATTIVGDRSN